MNVYLTAEQIYQLRELIYEEMDRLGGINYLSPELLEVSRKLLK
jgi:hypothetical protein